MAMPTRILIKVNLILIQYRTRKETERGLGTKGLGTGDWGLGNKYIRNIFLVPNTQYPIPSPQSPI
ncbi:hypothetical protein A6S26_23915 [Nostoc sp. ATCC 43529]|nr:hypothetical protein A6S26_23915 [Nostoc sp. ATCC 43529]